MGKAISDSRLTLAAMVLGILIGGSAAAQDHWVSRAADGTVTVKELVRADKPQISVRDNGASGVLVDIEVAGLMLSPRKTKGGVFLEVTCPEAQTSGTVGAPALPVIRRLVTAPPGVAVTLHTRFGQPLIVDLESTELPSTVMSRQAPIPKLPGAIEAAPFDFDEIAYDQNASLPAERATIQELGIVRGQRLLLLELRPVAYNPVAGTLSFWTDLGATINFAGKGTSDDFLDPPPGLQKIVVNPSVLTLGQRTAGNYLIVVASAFDSAIAPFAAAKEAQGFSVGTYSVAPGTSNAVIKSHIQSLWGTADSPDYILLVGDTETVPHWTGGGSGTPHTDLPYACMDGSDDWYPDIAIGRFPVDDLNQLQTMMDKTLYYENGPLADPGYLKRAVFMASVDRYQVSEGTHNYVIDNYMDPYGYQSDKLYQVTYGATTQDVRDSFNDGRLFGVYSGHGGTYSWADGPPFSQGDIHGLTNADLYAFVCSFACITGTYSVDECFMETWVLAPNKAAVAAWGSSVNSYWDEDDILEKRLFDAIFDNEDGVPTEAGPIYNEAKLRQLAHYGPTGTTRRYFEMYNLMGDPSLRLPSACSDMGEIQLDSAKYGCADSAAIEVTDCGLNLDDGTVDTVTIEITSDSEPGGESVLLTETDAASAQFTGSIDLSDIDGAGVLQVGEGDTVTATYIDADDGQGGFDVTVTDFATVDCTPPEISNVETTDVQPRSATVTFDSNELVKGTVHYGLDCADLTGSATSGGYSAAPVVSVTGLTDDTTYFYAVEAEDEAGNRASDDAGGACYGFTTPEVPDFFTEIFDGDDNDLDNISLLFTPNGSPDHYAFCAEPITQLPTDPAGGTPLGLSDDDFATVTLSAGNNALLYGTAFNRFYPVSNGYIAFGSGVTGYTESLEEHFSQPRISALYDDLDPSSGGTVSWKELDDRVAVTWLDVPEFSSSNSNTFQIVMYFDGRIEINYLTVAVSDGLAGLSDGTGLDPDFFESDLSAAGGCGPRPPGAMGMEVTTEVGAAVTFELIATDDGLPDPPGSLEYIITALPAQPLRDAGNDHLILAGELPYTLSGGGNEVTYSPSGGFSGSDSCTFKANDGGVPPEGGDSNEATVSITVGGPQRIFNFPMDSDPGWTVEGQWAFGSPTGGGSHDGDPTAGHTGDLVYGYNLAGDYSDNMPQYFLTTTAMDCTDLTAVELRYWKWLAVESSSYDHAKVEVSNDGGNWTIIWEHTGGSMSDQAWYEQVFDISAVADGEPTVFVRWCMGDTDGSVTYPGWNIDDVEVWAVTTSVGVPDCDPPSTCACPPADVNCDDLADGFDIAVIRNSANWLKSSAEADTSRADVNRDGFIDGFDIAAVRGPTCWLR